MDVPPVRCSFPVSLGASSRICIPQSSWFIKVRCFLSLHTHMQSHSQNTVRLPVYTTPQRRGGGGGTGQQENAEDEEGHGAGAGDMSTGAGFVFEADLRTDIHANYWILQGVCLLLNVD